MPNIRISQKNYDNLKSIMHGRSWDDLLEDLARPHLCTNNNAADPPKPPIPPSPAPYIEHNKAIILPSGVVLVNEEHNIVDINGQPIIFPDIPSVRKMVKYLKEYTSHPFQRCINQWRGNIITIERWYSADDERNGIPAIELAETQDFLRTLQTQSS